MFGFLLAIGLMTFPKVSGGLRARDVCFVDIGGRRALSPRSSRIPESVSDIRYSQLVVTAFLTICPARFSGQGNR